MMLIWIGILGIIAFIILTTVLRRNKDVDVHWSILTIILIIVSVIVLLIGVNNKDKNTHYIGDNTSLPGINDVNFIPITGYVTIKNDQLYFSIDNEYYAAYSKLKNPVVSADSSRIDASDVTAVYQYDDQETKSLKKHSIGLDNHYAFVVENGAQDDQILFIVVDEYPITDRSTIVFMGNLYEVNQNEQNPVNTNEQNLLQESSNDEEEPSYSALDGSNAELDASYVEEEDIERKEFNNVFDELPASSPVPYYLKVEDLHGGRGEIYFESNAADASTSAINIRTIPAKDINVIGEDGEMRPVSVSTMYILLDKNGTIYPFYNNEGTTSIAVPGETGDHFFEFKEQQ